MANYKCGVKPVPPVGCSYEDAICVCDSDGNCAWFFAGCGYSTFPESVGSDWSVGKEAREALGSSESRPKYLTSSENA